MAEKIMELEGLWQAEIGDGKIYPMHLPGTLDENQIGHKDGISVSKDKETEDKGGEPENKDGESKDNSGASECQDGASTRIATRFTRKYTYEGPASFKRKVNFAETEGKRVFLDAERARCLRLFVDGKEILPFRKPSLNTPHVFELTGLPEGEHEITLISDNSYPGLPHDAICYSSAATDETQTNWNGILGYFRVRYEEAVFLDAVRVYPMGDTLTVQVDLCADRAWNGRITLRSRALAEEASRQVFASEGMTEIVFEHLPLREDTLRWDEYEGNLYELTAELPGGDTKTAVFGIRDFGADQNGRLAINGRAIFLRSEANCAVFPETGYPPMSSEEWMEILQTYKSYGVNCLRFHSHCPPEAAFTAADRLGMLMQPELSHWNPKDAFESEEAFCYYRTELLETIRWLANHPSFVMLTFGNELIASGKGHGRMRELLAAARQLDGTRLYADSSNPHYGGIGCEAESDFYTAQKYYGEDLRGIFAGMEGYINHKYPNAMTNYDKAMEELRKVYQKPVFSFEVGQFEVLPDFGEIEAFHGVTEAENFKLIQERMKECGLGEAWGRYVEATGELSRIGYREEIEAAMRTEGMSGISLLGLQDFPGQGTALVGMLNSHLQSKPYPFARPEAFRAFFKDQLPLALLPKYTYESTEALDADIKIANFGKNKLKGCMKCRLHGNGFEQEIESGEITCPAGALTEVMRVHFELSGVKKPVRLELSVELGEASNTYPIWVYPPVSPVCPDAVYETEHLDERAKEVLSEGGVVYLSPRSTKEALPNSIQAQFTTDFWSVGTFGSQEGGMGQLIDASHPIFQDFPTEFHTNWQWWPMATQRAVILPKRYDAIITEMDSYAYLRPMAQLLECRCGNGKLLFSSMGLQDLQGYPEARALQASIYRYLESDELHPEQEIEESVFEALVK